MKILIKKFRNKDICEIFLRTKKFFFDFLVIFFIFPEKFRDLSPKDDLTKITPTQQ